MALGLALALLTSAGAHANPHLKQGIKLLQEMENEKAIKSLRRALTWKRNKTHDLAQIHLHLGIAQFNLMQTRAARRSFEKAIELEPAIELPKRTAPKIQEIFDKLRPAAQPDPAKPQPPRPPPPSTVSVEPPPPPPPVDTPAVRKTPSSTNWPAWATLGLAVAAGATAAGLAGGTVVENNRAADLSLGTREAEEHRDSAGKYALGANIMFGVAGAAALTSGVLFLVGWRKAQTANHVSVVPTLGGAMVQVGNISW
jgi:tetratricopeptide (TPR) repeat protein